MMNESTKTKTSEAVEKITSDLERIAKKALLFRVAIQAMNNSGSFDKFDYEMQFMEIATVIRNTAERIDEVLKDYKED